MEARLGLALQFLAIATAAAAIPGGVVLIAYAVHDGFFPYLADSVSIAKLGFISVVVAFIFLVGIGMGTALSLWLVWIAVRWSPDPGRGHLFLPPWRCIRLVYVGGSLLMFLLFLRAAVVAFRHGNPDLCLLLGYFFVTGFCIAAIASAAGRSGQTMRRLLPLAAITPVVLLFALPAAVVPLLNLCMTMTGLRSSRSALVLVDADAYQRIEDMAGGAPGDPAVCEIRIGMQSWWHLTRGVVVWNGGPDTLVATGDAGLPLLQVRPDQVLALPPGRVVPAVLWPDCEPGGRSLSSPPGGARS